MNLSKRQQLLGILAIAVLVIWAGDRLVLTPLMKLWNERATRIAELKKSVTQGSLLLDRDKSIRARWESMRTNTLSDEVSEAEDQVFRAFERWSQDSRIGVTSIKPQWKHTADDFTTLECRVDAFGSLPSLTRFLYEIEKDPLGLKVELVEVTTRDNRGDQLTLVLQVSGLQLNPSAIQ